MQIAHSNPTSTKTLTKSLKQGTRNLAARRMPIVKTATHKPSVSKTRHKSVMWILYVQ